MILSMVLSNSLVLILLPKCCRGGGVVSNLPSRLGEIVRTYFYISQRHPINHPVWIVSVTVYFSWSIRGVGLSLPTRNMARTPLGRIMSDHDTWFIVKTWYKHTLSSTKSKHVWRYAYIKGHERKVRILNFKKNREKQVYVSLNNFIIIHFVHPGFWFFVC